MNSSLLSGPLTDNKREVSRAAHRFCVLSWVVSSVGNVDVLLDGAVLIAFYPLVLKGNVLKEPGGPSKAQVLSLKLWFPAIRTGDVAPHYGEVDGSNGGARRGNHRGHECHHKSPDL